MGEQSSVIGGTGISQGEEAGQDDAPLGLPLSLSDDPCTGKKILVADDDRRTREVVAITLGMKDFTVLQAENGFRAVWLASLHHPDLVLLDVSMPGMDGLEACHLIKGNPSTAGSRVIMLTGSSGLEYQERARLVGATSFFSKPFSPLALLDKVHQVLGQPESSKWEVNL